MRPRAIFNASLHPGLGKTTSSDWAMLGRRQALPQAAYTRGTRLAGTRIAASVPRRSAQKQSDIVTLTHASLTHDIVHAVIAATSCSRARQIAWDT